MPDPRELVRRVDDGGEYWSDLTVCIRWVVSIDPPINLLYDPATDRWFQAHWSGGAKRLLENGTVETVIQPYPEVLEITVEWARDTWDEYKPHDKWPRELDPPATVFGPPPPEGPRPTRDRLEWIADAALAFIMEAGSVNAAQHSIDVEYLEQCRKRLFRRAKRLNQALGFVPGGSDQIRNPDGWDEATAKTLAELADAFESVIGTEPGAWGLRTSFPGKDGKPLQSNQLYWPEDKPPMGVSFVLMKKNLI